MRRSSPRITRRRDGQSCESCHRLSVTTVRVAEGPGAAPVGRGSRASASARRHVIRLVRVRIMAGIYPKPASNLTRFLVDLSKLQKRAPFVPAARREGAGPQNFPRFSTRICGTLGATPEPIMPLRFALLCPAALLVFALSTGATPALAALPTGF